MFQMPSASVNSRNEEDGNFSSHMYGDFSIVPELLFDLLGLLINWKACIPHYLALGYAMS